MTRAKRASIRRVSQRGRSKDLNIQTAHVLQSGVHSGDATSEQTFDFVRLLIGQGVRVSLFCEDPIRIVPSDIRSVMRRLHAGAYAPGADLTVLHYPVWSALAERLRDATGARIFWYQGVTPPDLWGTETDRSVLERSIVGTELAWHAHLAVTSSPFTADELHRHSSYPLERVRVVPLGIDTTSFEQPVSDEVLDGLRRKWKLEGKRVLLYTGRIAGNKRIDLLIEALARVRQAHPDVHLLVVGDAQASGAYREQLAKLHALVTELQLGSAVTFTGFVPTVEPYYHLASAYVLASQHEGFGVPLVEAMAAGVPIVASRSGSMPWVLGEDAGEPAGLLFPAGDVDALAERVRELLADPALAARLVARGRQRAPEFSKDRFRACMADVIAEAQALAQQGPPPVAPRGENPFYAAADVALRNYRVESRVPLLGPLIGWIRRESTTHVKEAYLDRIIERQVMYNRVLADEVVRLREELQRLRAEIKSRDAVGTERDVSKDRG